MIVADVIGSISKDVLAEKQNLISAVQSATRAATEGLKRELRAQITTAGMGRNLANSWQSEFYPNKGIDPGGYIYSKAPHIIESFDEGVIVRARRKRMLAIPTENAPKRINGRKATPWRYNDYIRKLTYVKRPGKLPLLVDEYEAQTYKRKTKSGKKNGDFKRFNINPDPAKAEGRTTVVIFILIPIAKMPRVLDVEGASDKWANEHVKLIDGHYNRKRRSK